ncbi:RNA exonuclease, putative [Talaromyces stipitatus ATCC 10500]|uniref:RNA exonuclease, putative n=1 Tax=Talaromyces stipitatus (strain ATCC 10500 / CBS 375.48 / QM 6759 / NRRL 1006) TaxID=441959 RepID=B8M7P3_TALSN|nr:RNA exonuclease, putative [Talaromyces stipitatus ATCC 10500]EED19596.1 RNA exonuclease, putative [Talaromyces stipitatus ATCC 10500]
MADNQTSNFAILTRKKEKIEQNGEKYTCRVCNRAFGSQKALRSHRSATNHEVRCSVCNKGFAIDKDLRQHARIHLSAAPGNIASASKVESVVTMTEVTRRVLEPENCTTSLALQVPLIRRGLEELSLNEDHYQQEVSEKQVMAQKQGFLHRLNTYTLLPSAEYETIYRALLAACHATNVLNAEQYILQGVTGRKTNTNVRYEEFRPTPQAVAGQRKRKIVAIDCEMVGLWKGSDSVVLLCSVDVLTGETLLNTLVNPVSKVKSWRSTVSGVTRKAMNVAIERGQALRGWPAARKALWQYVDTETILVGHALQNDLNVLGIFHPRIVDTAILAAQAVFLDHQGKKFPQTYGLKKLLACFVNMAIQTGKRGHDCLEDTLATREVAIWCMRNPESLKTWGSRTFAEYEARRLEIQRAREKAKEEEKEAKIASRKAGKTGSGASINATNGVSK